MFEGEHTPYINKKEELIDFEKKRLEFWLETVPKEIRRLEYDLWRSYRESHLLRSYQFKNRQKIGRYNLIPPVTEETDQEMWKNFQDSFLKGEERQHTFKEIIEQARKDLSDLKERIPESSRSKIRLGALTGSSVYGPRDDQSELSDVDVNFLMDVDDDSLNFEDLPAKENKVPYHVVATGRGDQGRLQREQIHWLLYPHYPLSNTYSDQELREIISELVNATRVREPQIREYLIDQDKKFRNQAAGLLSQ